MSDQFKRNIAYKLKINDILIGKPVFDQERFSFLELGDKRIVRVNLIGNVVDKYESEGKTKYCFLTLDDGSGQIKIKAFGDDVIKISGINQGDTIVVIGVTRNFNNETYIAPEIVREKDSKYLLVRKLELEKARIKDAPVLEKQEIKALKDRILEKIKQAEEQGGLEVENLFLDANFREASPEIINQEIKKLIEEGIVFEPRPGKVRYLG